MTGRQARPRKMYGRHRQAEGLAACRRPARPKKSRPAWTSGVYGLFLITDIYLIMIAI